MAANRTAVIIATQASAEMAAALVERMSDQTRPPDHVFVVGAGIPDVEGVPTGRTDVTACVISGGLAARRSHGATLAGRDHDTLVFFDDAFLPSRDWLAQACAYLDAEPDVSAVSGIVLTSGRAAVGKDIGNPATIVAMLDDSLHGRALFFPTSCLDAGNMAVRRSALQNLPFEGIPTQSLEFSAALAKRGRIGQVSTLFGMHLARKAEPQNRRLMRASRHPGAAIPNRAKSLPRAAFVRLASLSRALGWIGSGLGGLFAGRHIAPPKHVSGRAFRK